MGDYCEFINMRDPRFSPQVLAEWFAVGDLTDLTALDGAGWEQVATMDTTWHRRQSIATDEGVLESLTIPVTFVEGSTTITATVNVDASA